jgi:hypothetical protein
VVVAVVVEDISEEEGGVVKAVVEGGEVMVDDIT